MTRPGIRPLDELDQVDWSRLGHPASGDALPGIPELIRGLLPSGDTEDALWNAVLHQGHSGEATGFVLPFVFGLMLDHVRLRRRFCDWLVQTSWVFEHASPEGESTRVAWRNAADSLAPLLDDENAEVRGIAAGALSAVDDLGPGVWEALRRRLDREPDPLVAADLRLALAAAARTPEHQATSAALAQQWMAHDDPAVRAAGAHVVLRFRPRDGAARDYLASLLPDGQGGPSFFGAGTVDTIIEDLARGGLDGSSLPVVLDAPGRRGFFGDTLIIPKVLAAVFGPPGSIPPPTLTAGQALTLRRFAELPLSERHGVATWISPTQHELRVRGLPTDPLGLRTLAVRGAV